MAITGSDRAYRQARSGIARSGASRSGYVFPLFGVVTVNGVDFTARILKETLHVGLALNEEPDTASFDVMLTDSATQAALVVGADVVIALPGETVFGGRILSTQTTWGPALTPPVRSVFCADYLQVLDSEYLITFDWPPQSATATIRDLIARFANKPGGVAVSTAGVRDGLPSHATFSVVNERFSTLLRRLVTLFPTGGGFYVDPLKVLQVWAGPSEPNVQNPQPLSLANPTTKQFAELADGSQLRDACLVEGKRTNAPIGSPGPDFAYSVDGTQVQSLPVLDASFADPIRDIGAGFRECRIGSQRFIFAIADGVWCAPAGTPQTTTVTADVAFDPNPAIEANSVTIPIGSAALITGRSIPWVLVENQYLKVLGSDTPTSLRVPRSGFGAMMGPIKAGSSVTIADSLSALQTTGRYGLELARAQPIDSEVVLVVRTATAPSIHEHLVQDGRFSRSGATSRGSQEVADFRSPLGSITFETDDLNARPGRLQSYSLALPSLTPLTGEYMILAAELRWPIWGQPPRRVCRAAKVEPANVVDTWLADQR